MLWVTTPPQSPVADAARRNDVEAVRALLKQGADVNAAQGDGMTALHWAAVNGNVELARMLLYAGANVDAVTRIGDYTPLHLASKAGQATVIKALVESGANVAAATTTGGATPLHFAAASGSVEAVTELLDHKAEVNAKESVWGQTPLMWAAERGQVAVVKVLLQRRADFTLTTKVVDLPALAAADRAAGQRRDQVLKEFRAQAGPQDLGWRPSSREVQAAVQSARETPVAQAATADAAQRNRVQGALQAERGPGADSTQRPVSAPQAPPPGQYAAGGAGGVGAAAGAGARAPAEGASDVYPSLVGTEGGLTALLHAIREGRVETALALLEAGADINQVSAGDHTSPLLMALLNGHFDMGLMLLQRGADSKLASDAGTTPLYATIERQWAPKARYPQQQAYLQQKATYLDVMKALLDKGVDPNIRLKKHLWYMSYTFDLLDVDTQGATPFWRAAYATDVEAMRLLVAHGADPKIPTIKPAGQRRGRARAGPTDMDPSGLPPVPDGGPGVWPIHAASGVGYGEGYAGNAHRHVPDGWLPAVKYLVEQLGADVNARDHNGYTPLHHAAARGDNELIQYLVSKGADVTAVSRRGQTTADMANGPVQRISPFPETVQLLEKLGSKNNHRCMSC